MDINKPRDNNNRLERDGFFEYLSTELKSDD